MNLRSAPQGPLFQGTNVGDILTWNGSEWVVSSLGDISPRYGADQNNTAFFHTQGNPSLVIATMGLFLKANSKVQIMGETVFLAGGGVTGRALMLLSGAAGAPLPGVNQIVQRTFASGDVFTLAILAALDAQPAGVLTVELRIDQNSLAGATLASSGINYLSLQEIF